LRALLGIVPGGVGGEEQQLLPKRGRFAAAVVAAVVEAIAEGTMALAACDGREAAATERSRGRAERRIGCMERRGEGERS